MMIDYLFVENESSELFVAQVDGFMLQNNNANVTDRTVSFEMI